MSDIDISFVILNYNRKNELLQTIMSTKELAEKSLHKCEIIIVDNASSDGSVDAVKNKHADLVIIPRGKNNGIAGWNDGFAAAQGKYFVVLDDDSNVEDGLDEAINYLEHNEDVGILALKIAGGAFETLPEEGWIDKKDCPGFIGCGAIIRRRVYEKIGGFSEWLFIYTHEFDYGIRCLDAGYRINYFESCKVLHRASAINRSIKRLRIYSLRNELAIIYKYFPKNRWKYLSRIGINNLKVIKEGKWKAAWYSIIGMVKFLQFKHTIVYTPVSQEAQNNFAKTFTTTKPAWSFIGRAFQKPSHNLQIK